MHEFIHLTCSLTKSAVDDTKASAHNCTVLIGRCAILMGVARVPIPLPDHYGMEDWQEAQDRDLVCAA